MHRRMLCCRDADPVAAGQVKERVGAIEAGAEHLRRHGGEVTLDQLAAELEQRSGARRVAHDGDDRVAAAPELPHQ
jgi:hypothetical protein